MTNNHPYRVDGAVGRIEFETHSASNSQGIEYDSAKMAFDPLKPKQLYLTSGFKELAIIMGDTDRSFRKTTKLINHVRYQEENGTPPRTLHENTNKEGAALIEHLKKKANDINQDNFTADGECINRAISRGEQPVTLPMEKIMEALETSSTDYNPIEMLNNPVLFEDPNMAVNISIDDVTPKRQKDTRESPKVTQHDRKYVHDTVAHVESERERYVLNGDSIKTTLWFLNALLLSNSLFGKRLQIFTDGHKVLNDTILKFYRWYDNIQIILDWYHLEKKCKEQLSMGMKGRDIRNATLEKLMPLLWHGLTDKAVAYLESIDPSNIKAEFRIVKLIEYLKRNKPRIPNYELRKRLGLRNSSNIGEKMNDLLVSNRQKDNGMSWSKKGSLNLATVTALKINNEYEKWFRDKELAFRLVA
jgi:hypothetical protein